MTQKLYETDAYVQEFTATVLSCAPAQGGYAVVLDKTAFFPEGGGQPCDLGTLGAAHVTDVHTDGTAITHTTDAPLEPGAQVTGRIDWPRRLDAMQQHTGEHILSGALHRLFGAENVGFHIGSPYVRMDTSIPLTAAQLALAEAEANAAVRADTPVHCYIPDAATLAATEYRSKKELEGPVRLVKAGGDCCACCGTHLARTGEVGLIKIISAQHYKTGIRLAVACGQRAYDAVSAICADAEAAGRLLSAPAGSLTPAVENRHNGETALKQRIAALQNALADAYVKAAVPGQPAVLWAEGADGDGLRRIAMAVCAGTNQVACALSPGGQGTSYALAAPEGIDARALGKALNEAFAGRGGGKPAFCQGSLAQPGLTPEAVREKVTTLL
ncbi:MAG: alanyl-tRNA editing protein [Subdoligranulum variabile]|uniref:alanyl-tRNA editing protein n=1 Tax=Gemmiger sp. TaxID=2049027 RepID=UPI002A9127B8|nr:alanyl-tRNA editing protein [Gemmiger sp.]MDD7640294.1 alanyl-tRNA editing protein [Subdoligranulum variabile]MDY5604806.1 alanyl-tRNA editing protein [Gemmiger sp.]